MKISDFRPAILPELSPALDDVHEDTTPVQVPDNVAAAAKVVSMPASKAVKSFDYVFVGAGAAGGTAAADLADLFAQAESLRAKGFSVLVLEGGDDKQVLASQIPVEHGIASEEPDLLADPNRTGQGTGYWVKQYADPVQAKKDPKANANGEIWKPRGEGFGGSTRMNAMIFTRVDDSDWEKLAEATGDPSFRAAHMKPLLEQLTDVEYRPVLKALHMMGKATGIASLQNIGGHGFDGPLQITRADPKNLLLDAQLAKFGIKGMMWSLKNLGSPVEKLKRMVSMFDPNDDLVQKTEGPVLVPTSITVDGKRNGARDILLASAARHPDKLTLQDGARVSKLLFNENKKVTGVTYVDKEGRTQTVAVGREAIVAAGAYETPALLLRSGIGPKGEIVDLPGVGQHQGYRYEVGVVMRLKKPLKALSNQSLPVTPDNAAFKKWAEGKGGFLASNGVIMSFQMRSDPKLPEPDLNVFMLPGSFRGYKPGYSKEATADPSLVTFLVLHKNKGELPGELSLDPNNPNGAPIIEEHFHEKEGDTKPLIAGINKVREMVADEFSDMVESEVWPGAENRSDAALSAAILKEDWDHHPRGGAQLGHPNDSRTVVDSDFRVLGTTGLRVIDASVLPSNIGDFIVSGLYQIAKLAAKKIADDADASPKPAAGFNRLSIQMQPLPKSLDEARRTTRQAVGAVDLSPEQARAILDGTVSKADVDVAWNAIEEALEDGADIGDDTHVRAHNLLLAIQRQLAKQEPGVTALETLKDAVTR